MTKYLHSIIEFRKFSNLPRFKLRTIQKQFFLSNNSSAIFGRAFGFFLFMVFFLFSKDLSAQCSPTIFTTGGQVAFCIDDNTDYVLSIGGGFTPARDSFFGPGVTDVDLTDHLGIFNPSTAGVTGSFDINYQVLTGGGGCLTGDNASLTITINPIPDAGDDGVSFACTGVGSTVDLFSGLGGLPQTLGSWSTIGTVTPSGHLGTLNDTAIATLGVGVHDFVYTVYGIAPCVDSSATVSLTITPLPSITGINPIAPACDGEPASVEVTGLPDSTFAVIYQIGGMMQAMDTFTVSGGMGSFNTRPLSLADNDSTLSLIGISNISVSPNCDTTVLFSEILKVNGNPEVVARDTTICVGDEVNLIALLNRAIPGDSLEFGAHFGQYVMGTGAGVGIGSKTIDFEGPIGFFSTNRDSLLITLTETDTFYVRDSLGMTGCVDTTRIIVNVSPNPEIVGRDTAICEDQTVDLLNLLERTVAGDILQFKSAGGNYGNQSIINFNNPGSFTYYVRDSITSTGCSDTAIINVTVLPQPNLLGRDTTICAGVDFNLITLLNRTTSGDSLEFGASYGQYVMGTGAGVGAKTIDFGSHIGLFNAARDSLIVNLSVTDTFYVRDSVGALTCADTTRIIVNVEPNPIASLISDDVDNIIGTGQSIKFTASGGTSYEFLINGATVQAASPMDTFRTNTLSGIDTVSVVVSFGSICSDTASIIITVNAPPDAMNDTLQVMEDSPQVFIDVQANDTDPEGDALTTNVIVNAVNGVESVENNDSIGYVPNMDFNGLDSIKYSVCDGEMNCDSAWVIIMVTPVNDVPIANNDTLYTVEDGPVSTIDVQMNDSDVDGDNLITSIISTTGKGTYSIVGDTSIQYQPLPDSFGVDIITYQVCDTALCGTAIVYIEIAPVNDRPVAVKDSVTVWEDTTNVRVAILDNDFDVDGDLLTIDTVCNPLSGGTVMLSNDTVIYNPTPNYFGIDSIKYSICDGSLCDTNYLIVNVLPINEAPIAVKDSITIPEDTTNVKIAMLANDIEVDGDIIILDSLFEGTLGPIGTLSNDTLCYTPPANYNGLDSIKYIITDGVFKDSNYIIINILPLPDAPIALNDTITFPEDINQGLIPVQANDYDPDGDLFGTVIIETPDNGSASVSGQNILYTPLANFTGLDTIRYQICDVTGLCDSAYVFITVSGVNDQPVAVNDSICVPEDTTLVVVALEINDMDPDGNPTTVSILTAANHAQVDSIRNDSLVYVPTANFNGMDSIQYELSDGSLSDQAWVYITVKPVNDAPIAVVDSVNVNEDTTNAHIAITLNDIEVDEGDTLKASIVTGPTSGGTASILDDTTLVYTPPTNFRGLDTIVYLICDTSMACDMATVIVTVNSRNDRPIAVDDSAIATEDTTGIFIDVQANDIDGDGDALTTRVISSTMIVNTIDDDSIFVIPPPDFHGLQLVGYEICDNSGLCDTGFVNVVVLPVNDAPIAVTDTLVIPMDTMDVVILPLANDIDIDDDTLRLSTMFIATAANGTVNTIGTDSLVYTPNTGYSGLDTIHYTVCDTSFACDMGMILVSIGFINTPPIAVNDTVATGVDEDGGPIMVNVLVNDIDVNGAGDSLKLAMVGTPASGGTASIVGDSIVQYTPPLNFNGLDSVLYTVCDTTPDCANAWVFLTVNPVNDKPVAQNDFIALTKDTMNALIAVKVNDSDVDGDALSVTTIGNSTQGQTLLVENDSIRYSAPAGFVGVDTVAYEITDGALKDTAILKIIISDPNNVGPTANPDFANTSPNVTINIDVQDNDVEPDGDPMVTTIISGPKVGNTATVLNNDSIQYTPSISFIGADTIVYQVCDPSLTCDTDTVFITVTNIVQIATRVILEGPFDQSTGWMHDSLRVQNLIPNTEPYTTLPHLTGGYQFIHKNGGGGETIANPNTVLGVAGPNAIVDWVYLELLSAIDTMPIASRAALIQRDGDIVDVDGVSNVTFESMPDGNYFLSVRHRNHLGVMTKDPVAFMTAAPVSTLDFSTVGGTDAFGIHAMDTINNRLVLWAGDGNADRKVIYNGIANDRDPIFFEVLNDPLNTESNYNHISRGYNSGDYDLKGSSIYIGSGNDPDVIFFNTFLHPGNTAGTGIFIINEQIPR